MPSSLLFFFILGLLVGAVGVKEDTKKGFGTQLGSQNTQQTVPHFHHQMALLFDT